MSQAFSENLDQVEARDNSNSESSAGISTHESDGKANCPSVPFLIAPQQGRPSIKVTTDSRTLADDTLVELVCHQSSAGNELRFLLWKGESVSIVDHFEDDGCSYTPPVLNQKLSDLNLRLPSGVKACASSEELFIEIGDLMRSHIDLPETSICLATAFVMSTWFVDNLTVAPYLWLCGPQGSGKTTLLRLLHCLCRRGIMLAGTIPSPLYFLPALLRPTLLFDELRFNGTQHSHALESWLRAGNARGVPVAMAGGVVDSFGAKVLCSRQPVSDMALASRALHVSMVPTRKNLRTLDDQTIECIANDFQPRLLMFRLRYHREFRLEPMDLSGALSPRIGDLLRALFLPLRVRKEILNPLRQAVLDQVVQAKVESVHEPEAVVIRALFSYCHQPETSAVFVGHIASWINACRKKIGEETDLKARAVGSILKSLRPCYGQVGQFRPGAATHR